MLFHALNKKSKGLDNGGYGPLPENNGNLKTEILDFQPQRNRYYEEIKKYLQKEQYKINSFNDTNV